MELGCKRLVLTLLNLIILFCAIHVVLETSKECLRFLILKQYSTVLLKINVKTLEHPEPCSVLRAGHYPRTCVRDGEGGGPYF